MKKIIFLTDTDFHSNNSASTLIKSLAKYLSYNYKVEIILPSYSLNKVYKKIKVQKIYYHKIKYFNLKSNNNYIRFILEFLFPFWVFIIYFLFEKKNAVLLIIYSPSIFLSFFQFFYKIKYNIKTFIILRDHFPRWAVDLKIIKNRLLINFFQSIEYFLFFYADYIGIQSPKNSIFINKKFKKKIVLFRNWVEYEKKENLFNLKKKKYSLNLLYCGNIGPAQDFKLIEHFINLCKKNNVNIDFYGRGKFYRFVKKVSNSKNIKVFEEILHKKLIKKINLYDGGLITLNYLHSTTNIPGKFLTYIENNLPIFAIVNSNNELMELVNKNKIGIAVSSNRNQKEIKEKFLIFIKNIKKYRKGRFNHIRGLFSVRNNLKVITSIVNK